MILGQKTTYQQLHHLLLIQLQNLFHKKQLEYHKKMPIKYHLSLWKWVLGKTTHHPFHLQQQPNQAIVVSKVPLTILLRPVKLRYHIFNRGTIALYIFSLFFFGIRKQKIYLIALLFLV
jgi:hypothetical protein